MRTDLTDVVVLLDRSGSMQTIVTDMEGGFNALIEAQKKEPGYCNVTLFQFDNMPPVPELIYEAKPVQEVPPLKLSPRGGTPLFDAIGVAIVKTGERLAGMTEESRPGNVIFVIVTDGQENASREYNSSKVKELIERQSSVYSWEFNFLGANQDAVMVGDTIGILRCNAMTYAANASGVACSYNTMSDKMSSSRRGVKRGFTEEERLGALSE